MRSLTSFGMTMSSFMDWGGRQGRFADFILLCKILFETPLPPSPNTTEALSIPGVSEESLTISTNPLKMCLLLEVALVRNLQQQNALKEQNINNPRCNP